jgi:integrase/recombinase XerD
MQNSSNFPQLLERFFTQRLMAQRQASPHTIASYRDAFRLLLEFAQKRLRKEPSQMALADLDTSLIGAFLDGLEECRSNSVRSRNLRLAAIRSFFHYAAFEEPAHAGLIQRVLAMPSKRYEKKLVGFLTRPEIDALLAAPETNLWEGRRDRAFLLVAVQTGLRLSEITNLRRADVVLGAGAHVRCVGKGRKERCTPLTKQASAVLRAWFKEPCRGTDHEIVFPNARGGKLSPDGAQYLLAKHYVVAQRSCASLKSKRVTPHVLRHTAAMELLQAGVDRSVIALWLGHESVATTQIYFDANLALKERALAKTAPTKMRTRARYRPDDKLLAFLNGL